MRVSTCRGVGAFPYMAMKTKIKKMGRMEKLWNDINARVVFCCGVHRPNNCSHGPQEWSASPAVVFKFTALDCMETPSTGYRVWIYSKTAAYYFDVYFDRRRWPDGKLYAKT